MGLRHRMAKPRLFVPKESEEMALLSRTRRTRSLLLSLSLTAVLVGVLFWRAYARWYRDTLNRALIVSIQKNRTAAALTCLNDGADPNTRDNGDKGITTVADLLNLLLGRSPRPKTDGPPALLL